MCERKVCEKRHVAFVNKGLVGMPAQVIRLVMLALSVLTSWLQFYLIVMDFFKRKLTNKKSKRTSVSVDTTL